MTEGSNSLLINSKGLLSLAHHNSWMHVTNLPLSDFRTCHPLSPRSHKNLAQFNHQTGNDLCTDSEN